MGSEEGTRGVLRGVKEQLELRQNDLKQGAKGGHWTQEQWWEAFNYLVGGGMGATDPA